MSGWTFKTEADLLEAAWGVIANVNGGDWDKTNPDWKEAAEQWREGYHEWLSETYPNASSKPEESLEEAP